jgi:Xaa-Pro aminopeptidase
MNHELSSSVVPAGLSAAPPEGLVKAQLLARDVAEAAADAVWAGMTEKDLARWAEETLRAGGSTGLWTLVNVGFGAGSLKCFPTEMPGDRMLWNIDCGFIDVHPVVDGWWGDCTRTFVVGEQPEYVEAKDEIQTIHETVLAAAYPGMPANELWSAFHDSIAGTGWNHMDRLGNIGHSIGQNVSYTQGYIDRHNTTRMWGGWAVEPFIGNHNYGVKVEDVVWFGSEGCTIIR